MVYGFNFIMLHIVSRKVSTWHGPDVNGQKREVVALETVAGFCGHLLGFSMLPVWSGMQQRTHELLSVAVLAFVMKMGTLRLSQGVIDKTKMEPVIKHHWEMTLMEAQLESGAVQLSFLIVQALRFHITGRLPDQAGVEQIVHTHSAFQVFLCLFVCCIAHVAMVLFSEVIDATRDDLEGRNHWWPRNLYVLITKSLGFVCGWTLMLGVQFLACNTFHFSGHAFIYDTPLKSRVAVLSTFVAFILIAGLGRVAVMQLSGGHRKRGLAAMNVVLSAGLMVGFSWEVVFDSASEDTAWQQGQFIGGILSGYLNNGCTGLCKGEAFVARTTMTLLMGVGLFVVAMPAVFLYVSPNLLNAEEVKDRAYHKMLPHVGSVLSHADTDSNDEED